MLLRVQRYDKFCKYASTMGETDTMGENGKGFAEKEIHTYL